MAEFIKNSDEMLMETLYFVKESFFLNPDMKKTLVSLTISLKYSQLYSEITSGQFVYRLCVSSINSTSMKIILDHKPLPRQTFTRHALPVNRISLHTITRNAQGNRGKWEKGNYQASLDETQLPSSSSQIPQDWIRPWATLIFMSCWSTLAQQYMYLYEHILNGLWTPQVHCTAVHLPRKSRNLPFLF